MPLHVSIPASLLMLACLIPCSQARGADEIDTPATISSPIEPAETLRHFQLPQDVRIELVAAEPAVIDPIALRFDEQGRMWVVEMRDYPHGPAAGESPRSRITILTDQDGDGYFETSTVFAEGLLFATGVQPWQGGAFVTLAGRIAYLKDTDGDGRADVDETWFTGFVAENPQLRASYPRLGLDHAIYVANGLRGGQIVSAHQPEADPLSINGMDFRFAPHGGPYEAVSGMGQYGLTIDDFGRRFVCTNRNPLIHVVLENRYVRRNAHLALAGATHDVAAADAASRVYPLTRAWTTSNLHAGQFTAASGVLIYRGDGLPRRYDGAAFTCESTGNLVHGEILEPRGATFRSRAERDGIEFLASRDEWFRPVFLEHGPDGALYIADMYRAVIEHPQWMPEELRTRRDLLDGDDRGRIYRVVSKTRDRSPAPVDLAAASPSQLANALDRANVWQRTTAARLLFEQQDRTVQSDLEALVREGHDPAARARALWGLAGIDRLRWEIVALALDDPSPDVREQAVRLAEPWLVEDAQRRRLVIDRATDDSPRVRFQVALSLGEASSDDVLPALATIALADASDPWTRRAVATSVASRAERLLAVVLDRIDPATDLDPSGRGALMMELAELAGATRDAEVVARAIEAAARVEGTAPSYGLQHLVLAGVTRGLQRRGMALEEMMQSSERTSEIASNLARWYDAALALAGDSEADPARRATAIECLRQWPNDDTTSLLLQLAGDAAHPEWQRAALDSLANFRGTNIARALVALLPAQSPAMRRTMLDVLLSKPDWAIDLLDAIERDEVAATEIDPARRQVLLQHGDETLRARSVEVLGSDSSAEREEALRAYRPAIEVTGDPARGRQLFEKQCATCHRVGDVGVDVGPDISDSRVKTPLQLLTDILQPNRAIDANYTSYTVATTSGQIHVGLIAAETASSITLRQAENQTLTLLREDIEAIQSNGVSLMPEGMERNLTVEEMADLIAFVKNWRYLDGAIPLETEP